MGTSLTTLHEDWISFSDSFVFAGSTSALLDLSGLELPATCPSYPALPTLSGGSAVPVPDQAGSVSLLDDELMSLGEKSRAKALYSLTLHSSSLARNANEMRALVEVNDERQRGVFSFSVRERRKRPCCDSELQSHGVFLASQREALLWVN